jgi:hypothetical protein
MRRLLFNDRGPREEKPAMMTTLVFLAALSLAPGKADGLTVSNVRSTYGVLGAPRPDRKFLPGDVFVLSFDVNGARPDTEGKVVYSIGLEVTDAQGKVHFRQAPKDREARPSLGGTQLPAYASLQIGLDEPPGKYTLKVTVADRGSGGSQSVTSDYEVLPRGFGIVRLTTASDPSGMAPAPVAGEGQPLWLNFAAVGFERKGGQPNLAVELQIVDEAGRPTLARPLTGEVAKDVPDKARGVPMQFVLELNRAGKFTLELKATDRVSGKSASVSYPLAVVKAPQ